MNITTHIKLLKDIGLKPHEVMSGLKSSGDPNGEPTWSGVRTALERWHMKNRDRDHADRKKFVINMRGLFRKK